MEKFQLPWTIYLLAGAGGAVGAALRVVVGDLAVSWWGLKLPWGTLLVNLAGSLAIGFLAFCRNGEGYHWLQAEGRAFLLLGILGGFTTFSSFSLQTLEMLLAEKWSQALGYSSASLFGCVLAAWIGMKWATLCTGP